MTTLQPGSLVFCHSKGLVGAAIRLGERLRFRSGDFYNHAAIIDRPGPNGDWYVVQAEAHGVTDDKLLRSIAPGGSYEVVDPPQGTDLSFIVDFARYQVGRKYGWLSIASIAVQIIAPRWFKLPSIRTDRTWICSALGAEATRFGGWYHDWPDIYQTVPSEFYAALTGLSIRELPRIIR